MATKCAYEDLDEGKFSLPLIHLLEHSPSAPAVRGLLFHQPEKNRLSMEMKTWVVSEMKATGSLDYVANVLIRINDEILKLVDEIEAVQGKNSTLKSYILALRI